MHPPFYKQLPRTGIMCDQKIPFLNPGQEAMDTAKNRATLTTLDRDCESLMLDRLRSGMFDNSQPLCRLNALEVLQRC